jgi:hypothetical protein
MFQFGVLSGAQRGEFIPISQFPCAVGRGNAAQIKLSDAGIWDLHCRLELTDRSKLRMESLSGALTLVNGQSSQSCELNVGDKLQLGGLKLQLELSSPIPKSLRSREIAFWALLTAICLTQIAVIYILV